MKRGGPPSEIPAPEIYPRIASGHLRSDLDLTQEELINVLNLAAKVKQNPREYSRSLDGSFVSLLFEKPSLRTRLTFEIAVRQLGGDFILSNGPIGGREPVKDVARNLRRWTQAIVARTFEQQTVEELAEWSSLPVVNALSDMYHPCQALADMLTLAEHWGDCRGRKLTYVGDGNNVAHSLLLDCSRLGVHISVAVPAGFEPVKEIVDRALAESKVTGAIVQVTNDLEIALRGADAVYTDVWASMGQEQEAAERARLFASYQVNEDLMAMAGKDALFMHCLPAHRDEEVTEEVIEMPNSVVFDQAENRLHAQKALLVMLLGGRQR